MNAHPSCSSPNPPALSTFVRRARTVSRALRWTACAAGLAALSSTLAWAGDNNTVLPPSSSTDSTVPAVSAAAGDLNPYGIAFVPNGVPAWSTLKPGDVIVSNFNASSNVQGTGTTIVKLVPNQAPTVFFQKSGLGLTTALTVLRSGFVIVGSLPTVNGVISTPGSLLVINPQGGLVRELVLPALLQGPWDLAVIDGGTRVSAFVSNVLNGTVTRLDLTIDNNGVTVLPSSRIIASGYVRRPDPNALVVGPTGLAYDSGSGVLYVASTGDNAVFAIPNAASTNRNDGVGQMIYFDPKHLHGPLALALAPNGNLVTANGDAINPDPQQFSEIVEFTRDGQFVAQMQFESVVGAAFGIAFGRSSTGHVQFAAVDDNTNTAIVWTLR